MGAMRTCPTASMEVLLKLTPLPIYIRSRAERAILRMKKGNITDSWLNRKKFENLDKQCPEISMPWDTMNSKFSFTKLFRTEISNKRNWEGINQTYQLTKSTIAWFTDGSLTHECAGAGTIGPGKKH
ncbi:uncharacterized protein LOC119665219 [Teleopsis dalmanni]|uniref:uncharacterized protein LOC119665219 n=1 Tax=Teleopsis dalmanni TaxID=139649 RepID=UPI0018CCB6CD|nr:uncharacterized protein LOC119665219 [Teleopsis dalmanni]